MIARIATQTSPAAPRSCDPRVRELETLHLIAQGITDVLEPRGVLVHALETLVQTGWFQCGEAFVQQDAELDTVAVGFCRYQRIDACPVRPQLKAAAEAALAAQRLDQRSGWWLVPIDPQAVLALAGGDVSRPFVQACLDMVRASLKRARLHQRLSDKEQQRARLLQALLSAQEEERARISRDLHDQVGQALTGILLGLEAVLNGANAEQRRRQLEQLKALASGTLADVRRIALEMRPSVLDELGLEAALKRQAREFESRYGIATSVLINLRGRLTREAETVFYRVAQEALTNVVRHARAARVSLVLSAPSATLVQLVIEDDGVGFAELPAPTEHLGLTGMRERLELLGGRLDIESSPGQGSSLYARLPLRSAP